MRTTRLLVAGSATSLILLSGLAVSGCSASSRSDNARGEINTTDPVIERIDQLDAQVRSALDAISPSSSTNQLPREWIAALNVPQPAAHSNLDLATALNEITLSLPPLLGAPEATTPDEATIIEATKAYVQGRDLLLRGDTRGALPLLEQVVSLDASSSSGWRELGRARMALSDLAGARAALLAAVSLDESDALAWESLGQVSTARREPNLAAWAHGQALAQSPQDYALRGLSEAALGEQLARLGYYRAAAESIENAVDSAPELVVPSVRTDRLTAFLSNRTRAMLFTGSVWIALGDLERARDAYRRAAEYAQATERGSAWLGFAAILNMTGDVLPSVWSTTRAIERGIPGTLNQSIDLLALDNLSPTDRELLTDGIEALLTQARNTLPRSEPSIDRLGQLQIAVMPPAVAAEQLVDRLRTEPESVEAAATLAGVLAKLPPSEGVQTLARLMTESYAALEPTISALILEPDSTRYTAYASDLLSRDGLSEDVSPVALALLRPIQSAPELDALIGSERPRSAELLRISVSIAHDAGEQLKVARWIDELNADDAARNEIGLSTFSRVLKEHGNFSAARDRLLQIDDITPDDLLELARVELDLGMIDSSLQRFSQVDSLNVHRKAVLLGRLQASQTPDAGPDIDTAQRVVQTLLQQYPDAFETRFVRALVLAAEGRSDQASSLLQSLGAIHGSPIEVFEQLSAINPPPARRSWLLERLQFINKQRPADAAYARVLAELHVRNADTQAATEVYERGLDFRPGDEALSRSAEQFYIGIGGDTDRAQSLRTSRLVRAYPTPANTIQFIALSVDSTNPLDTVDLLHRVEAAGQPVSTDLDRASELITWLSSRSQTSSTQGNQLSDLAAGIAARWNGLSEQALHSLVATRSRVLRAETPAEVVDRVAALTTKRQELFPSLMRTAVQGKLSLSEEEPEALRRSIMAGERDVPQAVLTAFSIFESAVDGADNSGIDLPIAWLGMADQWGAFGEQGVTGATRYLYEHDLLENALLSLGASQSPTQNEQDIAAAAARLAQYLGGVSSRIDANNVSIAVWKAGLALAPQDAELLNSIAFSQLEMGVRLQESTAYAEQAAESRPDSAAIVDTLAYARLRSGILEDQGELRGALSLFKDAIQIALDDGDGASSLAFIYNHLGDALWLAGDRDGAIDRWVDAETEAKQFLALIDQDPDQAIPAWGRREFEAVQMDALSKLDAVIRGENPVVIQPIAGE